MTGRAPIRIVERRAIAANRSRVWALLREPAALARILPACTGVVPVPNADRIIAAFDARFMGFHERFEAQMSRFDEQADEQFRMRFTTQTRMGGVTGEGVVRFEADGASTVLSVLLDVERTGLVAALGEGMLRGLAGELLRQVATAVEKEIGGQ